MTGRGKKYEEEKNNRKIARRDKVLIMVLVSIPIFIVLTWWLKPRPSLVDSKHKKWHTTVTAKIDCYENEASLKYLNYPNLLRKVKALQTVIKGFNTNASEDNIQFIEQELINVKQLLLDKGSAPIFCN